MGGEGRRRLGAPNAGEARPPESHDHPRTSVRNGAAHPLPTINHHFSRVTSAGRIADRLQRAGLAAAAASAAAVAAPSHRLRLRSGGVAWSLMRRLRNWRQCMQPCPKNLVRPPIDRLSTLMLIVVVAFAIDPCFAAVPTLGSRVGLLIRRVQLTLACWATEWPRSCWTYACWMVQNSRPTVEMLQVAAPRVTREVHRRCSHSTQEGAVRRLSRNSSQTFDWLAGVDLNSQC